MDRRVPPDKPCTQDELRTTDLRRLLGQFQQGDTAAMDEILRRCSDRLDRMARAMLRRYPRVSEMEQTGDVVNEAMISLVGALRSMTFTSTREFYGLVAEHMRRRLLDLTRRYGRPDRVGKLDDAVGGAERIASPVEEDIESWQALHEAVEKLPAELREVFSLRLYQGWTNQQIAELLQVSDRTVKRAYLQAQIDLRQRLGGRSLPEGESG